MLLAYTNSGTDDYVMILYTYNTPINSASTRAERGNAGSFFKSGPIYVVVITYIIITS